MLLFHLAIVSQNHEEEEEEMDAEVRHTLNWMAPGVWTSVTEVQAVERKKKKKEITHRDAMSIFFLFFFKLCAIFMLCGFYWSRCGHSVNFLLIGLFF